MLDDRREVFTSPYGHGDQAASFGSADARDRYEDLRHAAARYDHRSDFHARCQFEVNREASWATAAWFITHADQYGIDAVRYQGKEWTRSKGWHDKTGAGVDQVEAHLA